MGTAKSLVVHSLLPEVARCEGVREDVRLFLADMLPQQTDS